MALEEIKLFDEGQKLEYLTPKEIKNKNNIVPALKEVINEFIEKLN